MEVNLIPSTMMLSPELIAQFRYTAIAPLVTRSLQYGEQRALVAQQATQVWEWPDGQTRTIHARTLLRWVAAYRTEGLAALQPQGDTNRPLRQTDPAVLERAVALRPEDPHRSARMIIQMLEWAHESEPGSLAYSTLYCARVIVCVLGERHSVGKPLCSKVFRRPQLWHQTVKFDPRAV